MQTPDTQNPFNGIELPTPSKTYPSREEKEAAMAEVLEKINTMLEERWLIDDDFGALFLRTARLALMASQHVEFGTRDDFLLSIMAGIKGHPEREKALQRAIAEFVMEGHINI